MESTTKDTRLEAVSAILSLERFMPVMTPDELRRYETDIIRGAKPDFSPDTAAEWERRLADREAGIAAKFAAAYGNNGKRERECSRKKVRK